MFDEYLLGWRSRDFAIAAEHKPRVYMGGLIGPAAVADGRIVGTWKAVPAAGGLEVTLEPFVSWPTRVEAALQREGADLARFEGLEPAS